MESVSFAPLFMCHFSLSSSHIASKNFDIIAKIKLFLTFLNFQVNMLNKSLIDFTNTRNFYSLKLGNVIV